MPREIPATLVVESDGYAFISFDTDGGVEGLLDAAENALYRHPAFPRMKRVAPPSGRDNGNRRLDFGTVTVDDDGGFAGVNITADLR